MRVGKVYVSRETRKRRILQYVKGYKLERGETPTLAEIGETFDLRSPASVHDLIDALIRDGKLTKVPNVSRGIRIVEGA